MNLKVLDCTDQLVRLLSQPLRVQATAIDNQFDSFFVEEFD